MSADIIDFEKAKKCNRQMPSFLQAAEVQNLMTDDECAAWRMVLDGDVDNACKKLARVPIEHVILMPQSLRNRRSRPVARAALTIAHSILHGTALRSIIKALLQDHNEKWSSFRSS